MMRGGSEQESLIFSWEHLATKNLEVKLTLCELTYSKYGSYQEIVSVDQAARLSLLRIL